MSMFTLIKNYFHLNSNLKKTREKVIRLREKKFRNILKYAFNNSKFYHDLYTSLGFTKEKLDKLEVEKLPVIDKEIVGM